ncbi:MULTISPECIES: DUF1513 domain-containing protein [unclassified Ruegeria]|uniref:DUF1513 domain-containing protein n=1 Tax=unclassified Ruegeria TaxID=2625375 RepID=UPI001487C3A6|nr:MULTISPECIES: DUF1513 domain-containing protein [unclassified Ruegeria]
MTSRRRFLAGLAAASLAPTQGWAAIGAPDYLAAALFPDGSHRLVGLLADGSILFSLILPARGHAAAAHPHRPQAVAFARRPGTFAVIIDCTTGAQTAALNAPDGRHFYGHGAFSQDGTRLFTTENDYEAGEGVIGVWETAQYTRLGEFPSGGTGPHDIRLMADGKTLVIANGGIETHPDTGRTKLNLPVMQPNLTYLDLDGSMLEQAELPPGLRQNSIRHLAVRPDGLIGFATQWQGQTIEHPPLLGLHRPGDEIRLLSAPNAYQSRLQGYAGSIAFSGDGASVAITCPRGNALHQFRVEDGQLIGAFELDDVCGLGTGGDGFVYTTGTGAVGTLGATVKTSARQDCQWDNHLIPVGRPA